MKLLTRSARRGVAAGLTGALVAGAFAGLAAAPAQAAPATGALTWNISEQFVNHLSTRTLSGGATFDEAAGTFAFPADSLTQTDGTVTTSFKGSVEGAFGFGGTEYYAVIVANPVVEVEADGSGEVRATVSARNAAAQGNPAGQTQPAEVTVAEFDAATVVDGTTTITPRWEGVLEAGSQQALDLGITNTARPVDGKSFHPDFLGQLTSGVRAHFYFSGSGDHKRPGDLSFSTSVAAPSVTATLSDDRTQVDVQGTNFVGGDENYQGIYIGIAESGGLPATGSLDNRDLFIASDWITAERIVDGAFAGRLLIDESNPDVPAIKPGVEYSVYTWQAHRHTTDALDTETRVGVLKDEPAPVVKKASKVKLKINKKANRKRAGKATVTVQGKPQATGRVVFKIKVPGVKKIRTVKVKLNKKGKATVKLVKAKKKGQYRVRVKYNGDKNWKASKQVTKKYRVKK